MLVGSPNGCRAVTRQRVRITRM